MSNFWENFALVASTGFFIWLYKLKKMPVRSIADDAAQANNTAPFWFTSAQPGYPASYDFASQSNYMD